MALDANRRWRPDPAPLTHQHASDHRFARPERVAPVDDCDLQQQQVGSRAKVEGMIGREGHSDLADFIQSGVLVGCGAGTLQITADLGTEPGEE